MAIQSPMDLIGGQIARKLSISPLIISQSIDSHFRQSLSLYSNCANIECNHWLKRSALEGSLKGGTALASVRLTNTSVFSTSKNN